MSDTLFAIMLFAGFVAFIFVLAWISLMVDVKERIKFLEDITKDWDDKESEQDE